MYLVTHLNLFPRVFDYDSDNVHEEEAGDRWGSEWGLIFIFVVLLPSDLFGFL